MQQGDQEFALISKFFSYVVVDYLPPPESLPRLAAVQALFATGERPHAALGALQRPGCPQLVTLDAPRTSRAPCARSQTIRPVASRCSPRAGTPNVGASPLRDPCRREAVERALWGSSRCRGAEYERPFRPVDQDLAPALGSATPSCSEAGAKTYELSVTIGVASDAAPHECPQTATSAVIWGCLYFPWPQLWLR